MKDFPDKLIRGISNPDFISKEGRPTLAMFQFDENNLRTDNYVEASINWLDNEGAITQILYAKKDGTDSPQFRVGYAIMSKEMLDLVKKTPMYLGYIDYERRIVDGNDYHGNLLVMSGLDRGTRNMTVGAIATCVDDVVYRQKDII